MSLPEIKGLLMMRWDKVMYELDRGLHRSELQSARKLNQPAASQILFKLGSSLKRDEVGPDLTKDQSEEG
jgi:hypothetical protein